VGELVEPDALRTGRTLGGTNPRTGGAQELLLRRPHRRWRVSRHPVAAASRREGRPHAETPRTNLADYQELIEWLRDPDERDETFFVNLQNKQTDVVRASPGPSGVGQWVASHRKGESRDLDSAGRRTRGNNHGGPGRSGPRRWRPLNTRPPSSLRQRHRRTLTGLGLSRLRPGSRRGTNASNDSSPPGRCPDWRGLSR
jgi:hypothetical protein